MGRRRVDARVLERHGGDLDHALDLPAAGDVIVHSEPLYGGTEFLAHNILPQFDIRPEGFGSGGTGRPLEAAIRAGRKRGRVAVIYVETPANPTNGLVDIAHCRERADRLKLEQNHRPPVIVDNTFLGPLWQQPSCRAPTWSCTR